MQYEININEPLYPNIEPYDWEVELFQSKSVRRLKQLAHFGAGSFVSSVVHSRFEHTIGVWKLAAYFYPKDNLLRAAAILHDIGHLPFSHSVEKTLGFNHHHLTEQYIVEEEISSILQKASITPKEIIDFLKSDTVLTGLENVLGIDHLDSFFRDTYMAGDIEYLPKDILPKLKCTSRGIETDKVTGRYLLKLIKSDHEHFLSPFMVAVDRLLAEAISCHWNEHEEVHNREDFARLTDSDVMTMLKNSNSKETRKIIHALLYEHDKINISNQKGMGIPISIRKVYLSSPLYEGELLTLIDDEAEQLTKSLSSFSYNLYVSIK